jgi:hypothetical protein
MDVITEFRRDRRHRGGLALALGLLGAATLACVTAPPGAKPELSRPEVTRPEPFTASDHSFRCEVPEGWERAEGGHPYGDLTPIFGVRLTGPKGADEVSPTISVLHYSAERLFKTPDEFIHSKLNSMARLDHDRMAPVRATTVAGRPAKAFQIRTFKLVYLPQPARPPLRDGIVYELAPPHRQVDLVEHCVVVPASRGYFVLSYSAPQAMFEAFQGTFDRVAASFQPQLP